MAQNCLASHDLIPDVTLIGCKLAGGVFSSEAGACFGIDVQTPDGAPPSEAFRVDYGSIDLVAFGFEIAELLFRLCLPSCKSLRQNVRILHDPKNLRIIGLVEPADPDGTATDRCATELLKDFRACSHGSSPFLAAGGATTCRGLVALPEAGECESPASTIHCGDAYVGRNNCVLPWAIPANGFDPITQWRAA